jgi:glycosyltransferase involved in cell wall biosynthesis
MGLESRISYEVVERAALRDRYRSADVVVFPSEWDEPFGLVPLEAMACSTPVTATGTGGSADFLVDGANCVLFRPGDPAHLADVIRQLADDPGRRVRLLEGGRATAAALTVDRLAEVLEAWHVSAAEGFARGRPSERPSPLAALR